MRSNLLIAAATLAGLVVSVPAGIGLAGSRDRGAPIMPLSEVKPGMKGYGLTVFSGTEPERFDVEVIGILRNFLPRQDLILIRTPHHPRLEVARIVAGMSGSPIYINDKMVGAYAYGWQFPAEAVAGVTPIQAMLDEAARPVPPIFAPVPPPAPKPPKIASQSASGTRYLGEASAYDLHAHASQLRAIGDGGASFDGARLVPASTPIMLGGMGEGSASLARELLEPLGLLPLQAGGAGNTFDPDAPARYVDGGAIGVQLVSGDISAMGIGTVTRVDGPRLVAFGHPMMQAGVSALPTAVARVHWVMATQARSFKMGEAVRPLGALVNDRQAAIVVDERAQAPTFPVSCVIEGAEGIPHPRWSFTVAHEAFMSPAFVAMAVGSALDSSISERRDVTWSATTEIGVRGKGTVRVEDFGVAIGGTPDARAWSSSRAVRALGALLNNPWEPVVIEKVETRFRLRYSRDIHKLRGSQLLTEEVDAGSNAKIRLHLIPYAGPEQTRIIEVPIPRELAGKEIEIELTPGYQEVPERAAPGSVSELMANLERQSFPPDSLVASIKLPEHGVSHRGLVASRLPPSALDVLRPARDTNAPEPFVAYARKSFPIRYFVEGKDRVKVRVRQPMR